jgi:hypothetical protein
VTGEAILAALTLPPAAAVNRRVPKSLLVEHGAPTPADRRHVHDSVESLMWVAALKPGTVGVAAFQDATREYLEIAVLSMSLRGVNIDSAAAIRLQELVHRAVPYPVILVADSSGEAGTPASGTAISAAHLRWSQGEAGRTVLEGDPTIAAWPNGSPPPAAPELDALALGRQPHTSMFTLYDGWLATITAMLAARVTGTFTAAEVPEQTLARKQALAEWDEIGREVERIRAEARRESQMARRMELNRQLKALEERREAARERMR